MWSFRSCARNTSTFFFWMIALSINFEHFDGVREIRHRGSGLGRQRLWGLKWFLFICMWRLGFRCLNDWRLKIDENEESPDDSVFVGLFSSFIAASMNTNWSDLFTPDKLSYNSMLKVYLVFVRKSVVGAVMFRIVKVLSITWIMSLIVSIEAEIADNSKSLIG